MKLNELINFQMSENVFKCFKCMTGHSCRYIVNIEPRPFNNCQVFTFSKGVGRQKQTGI